MVNSAATAAAPASVARSDDDAAIDIEHLNRMTLGEPGLQAEVLRLFDRQAEMLTGRMAGASPAVVAALAHTLKGSARGIGAPRVARAAEAVELAAALADESDLVRAVEQLSAAIAEARLAITGLLQPR